MINLFLSVNLFLKLKKSEKSKIFGLSGEKIKLCIKKRFSIPILFEGNKK